MFYAINNQRTRQTGRKHIKRDVFDCPGCGCGSRHGAVCIREEVSMEAMRCTGTIIPDKKPAHVALCLQEFVAEAPKLYADGPEKKDLTYGFFAARHADTVISECAVYFPHTSTEEYLPIRILSVIMIINLEKEKKEIWQQLRVLK